MKYRIQIEDGRLQSDLLEAKVVWARMMLLSHRERTLNRRKFELLAEMGDNHILLNQIEDMQRGRKQKG